MRTYDSFTGVFQAFEIESLRSHVIAGFVAAGMSDEEATLVGSSLVEAELRDNPTHGLMRFSWYVASLKSGQIAAVNREQLSIEHVASAVRVEGTGNLGYLPTVIAIDELAQVAQGTGIGIALVRGISEFGRAAYYSSRLADRGLISIVMQNTMPLINAPGGTEAVVGNNPLSYSIPGKPSMTFDAAFTARSGGEVHLRRILDVPLEEEWNYVDSSGNLTVDANEALSTAQEAVGGAKGFGIAALIDIMAGALTGAKSNVDIRPGFPDVGATVIAIDPDAVGTPLETIESAKQQLRDAVVASGGRWSGVRSDQALEAGIAAGKVHIPVPIITEVNNALESLGLEQLQEAA